ncbi:hypothetical protein Q9Q99_03990 [Curtobacterium flaccumfaciens]|nr:hypothetical protein Q9Q99_03990 [Curtobacterium flaccumfaciens]
MSRNSALPQDSSPRPSEAPRDHRRARRPRLAAPAVGPSVRLPGAGRARGRLRRGVRVKVPLRTGARMSDGYVVEIVTEGEYPGELSQIEAVLSPVPVLAPEIWTLARRRGPGCGRRLRRPAPRRTTAAGARREGLARP